MNKRLIFALFLILLILISGCKGRKDTQKALEEIRTGTQGIVISFLPNAPPERIHVEQNQPNEFDVILEVKNRGAYPQPDQGAAPIGNVYLSGYDPNIIKFDKRTIDLHDKALEGKSSINPNGGLDFVTFKGTVNFGNLNVEKYDPILLSTVCYFYETVAGPPVCIDPNPYSPIKEKKVCEVKSITLTNQGAPIAITKIDEEAFATKTQFKITIKNIGGGDVIKLGGLPKCDTFREQKLEREDLDKVFVKEVKAGNRILQCRPFIDKNVPDIQGNVRLINGEGFIICELLKDNYNDAIAAFTTPLTIRLEYIYKTTSEKKIQIKRETGGIEEGVEEPYSPPIEPQPPKPQEESYPYI